MRIAPKLETPPFVGAKLPGDRQWVFHATGRRVRELPITLDKLL
jgi:hypothetical protein